MQRFVIIAEGSNLRDLFKLQTIYDEIDFNSITCDNHYLVQQFFGKSACKHKIYNEVRSVFESKHVDNRHLSFISSVMLQTGKLTSIESDGLRQRNPDCDLLAVSDGRAVHSLLKSAVQNKVSVCQSVSDQSLIGQLARSGTVYNQLIVNQSFVDKNKQTGDLMSLASLI